MKMTQLTLDEWKHLSAKSSHVRKGEQVKFSEPNDRGVISAYVIVDTPFAGNTIHLGFYFTKDEQISFPFIAAGSGWFYD